MFLRSLLFSFLLISCAGVSRKDSQNLRDYYKNGDFKKAKNAVMSTALYKSKDSSLLKYFELGSIYFKDGLYSLALDEFNKAHEHVKKNFTIKISKKITQATLSETEDLYYGQKYEVSQLFYYLSLSHYLLYQKGFDYKILKDGRKSQLNLSKKDRRDHLFKARAHIFSWNNFLENLKRDRSGKSVFKVDLMAKILGGTIHEEIGSSSEKMIALNLYKEAIVFLERNYSSYPTFNDNFLEFKKDFDKFHLMKIDKVRKDYIKKTKAYQSLRNYLIGKVLNLSKKIRTVKTFKLEKKYGVSKKNFKMMRKGDGEIQLITHHGLIPQKTPEKVYFGLGEALKDSSSSSGMKFLAAIGVEALTYFAANTLGLVPEKTNNLGSAFLGLGVSRAFALNAAISFELPVVISDKIDQNDQIKFINIETKKEFLVKLNLVNPLSNIAEEAVAENSSSLYRRIGIRLALKHASAIASSYGTYSLLKKNGGMEAFLAKNAAVAQYLIATKAIEATEKADLRSWLTLPKYTAAQTAYIPAGKYQVFFKEKKIDNIEVKASKKILLNYHL